MKRKSRLFLEAASLLLASLAIVYMSRTFSTDDPKEASGFQIIQSSSEQIGDGSKFLKLYKADEAFEGFTLYPVEGGALIHLLNMRGQIVHSWNVDVERARLLPNCNLLALHGSKWGRYKKPWRGIRDRVIEYDWKSSPVWQYEAADVVHHDVHRLSNGHTLFLRRTMVPASFKEKIHDVQRRSDSVRGDSIIEVDATGSKVWSWHAHEHMDLNSCGKRKCPELTGSAQAAKKARDWTHMNTSSPIPENKWFDSGDTRFRPGNIIILPRNWWTAYIVDRSSQQIVWEYRGDFKGGLGGGHEAHMIPKGLPGAGNILIFDNGASVHPNESIALEVNPVSKKVVWHYKAKNFFSPSRGALQRLPNGNTLISEDITGRAFEVNPEGEIVWEYHGPKPINRVQRYSKDYCAKFSELR